MLELIFTTSLVFLMYTYIGYPVAIWVLASLSTKSVRSDIIEPSVVVIIVAFNERQRIVEKIETCLALDYPHEMIKVLVASDGSDDGTNECVESFSEYRVELLAFPHRRGKASCLNDAIASRDEEIIVLTDVRQRLDNGAVRKLVQSFADPEIGAVSGELVFETGGTTSFGVGIDVYWRYEKFIRRQESYVHSTVGVTGAFYALRRECFCKIPADTILDDVVIPMNIVMKGFRVAFDGGALAYDKPSVDYQQEKSRKVRTAAGNYQLMLSHPSFFVPLKNPIFFQLVSHKVLRLVSPFWLILLFVSNIMLASTSVFYQSLMVCQIVAYSFAVLGSIWRRAGDLRVVAVANAFLLLNWFALMGLFEFLRNRRPHLWR